MLIIDSAIACLQLIALLIIKNNAKKKNSQFKCLNYELYTSDQ